MHELDAADLEQVTAGKDVREQALVTLRSLDRAAQSADREIARLGKSLGG